MLSGGPAHVLPVVKAHVTGNQRPVPDLRPEPRDGMGRPDRNAGHVVGEPGPHLVPHYAGPLLQARRTRQPIDILVELRMLHAQATGRPWSSPPDRGPPGPGPPPGARRGEARRRSGRGPESRRGIRRGPPADA